MALVNGNVLELMMWALSVEVLGAALWQAWQIRREGRYRKALLARMAAAEAARGEVQRLAVVLANERAQRGMAASERDGEVARRQWAEAELVRWKEKLAEAKAELELVRGGEGAARELVLLWATRVEALRVLLQEEHGVTLTMEQIDKLASWQTPAREAVEETRLAKRPERSL